MITSLLAFLGGGLGRMIFGELMAFLNKAQEHKQELDRIQAQERADAATHSRNMESIKTQADLQVKVITVQGEVDTAKLDMEAFLDAVKAVGRPTGIAWVDAWNSTIRPAVATWSVLMLTAQEVGWLTLSENATAICSAALGIYLASRDLLKRGK